MCALCTQGALEQNCCISRPVTLSLQSLMQGQQPDSKRMGTRPNTQRILGKSLSGKTCAKAKGGGLFFPLQTSCYLYSKDSAASNSHWGEGGTTSTAQMYLFEVFPEPKLNIYPLSAYSFMDVVL